MRALALLLTGLGASAVGLHAQDRVAHAYDAYRTGQYDVAVSVLSNELRSRPDLPTVMLLDRVLRETGRYAEAEELLRKNLDRDPDAVLLTDLGEILMTTGRNDEALEVFQEASARGGPGSLIADLHVAEIQARRGARVLASEGFRSVVVRYNDGVPLTSEDLAAVGAALVHLGREDYQYFRDALRLYDRAIATDSTNLDAQVALGDLFLGKYNGASAKEMYQLALSRNPRHPAALLGLAQVRRFDGASDAFELTDRSLDGNPDLMAARVLKARQFLDLEAYAKADDESESALKVNSNSAEALTMLAASAMLQGDEAEFERRLAGTRAIAPGDVGVYIALAEVAARNRLYHRAVDFADQAILLDANSWRGYALRGINQLRTGQIVEGRADLEIAFAGDPFDVWTKNTLDLLDDLAEYRVLETEHFELVIPTTEAELLALYLAPLAEAAYDSLAAHYGITLPTPLRIEVFPRHADFSVRTIGLVGLGALGVSFGPVIALDAASSRPAGDFHWGATLWHELAHSFHMEMSGYRVPRWFTEGLAVHEERKARPGWGDRVSPEFLIAYQQDRLAPVEDLNQGFMRPAYPQQIGFSYYQSSLVFDYIDQRWGFAAIVDMLVGYRNGLSTPEVFANMIDVTLDDLAVGYDEYFRNRFAGPLHAIKIDEGDAPSTMDELQQRAAEDSTDFLANLAVGQALLKAGDTDESLPYLERAKALFPEYAGGNSPYWLIAGAHQRAGRTGKVLVELEALTAINRAHYPGLRTLATVRADLADVDGAAWALESAQYVYPYEEADHRRLATWFLETGQAAKAIRERRAVLALRPFNRAEALYQLALAQLASGDRKAARSTVLQALEQAPNYEEALELLLDLQERKQ